MHVACYAGSFNAVEYLYQVLGSSCLIDKDSTHKTCLGNFFFGKERI